MDPATPLQPYIPPAPATQGNQSGPVNSGIPMQQAPLINNPLPPLPQGSMLPQQPMPSSQSAPFLPPLPPVNNTSTLQPVLPIQSTSPKNEVVEQLKKANNVLVTVSNNPSVDQLAAAIGLTLALNKIEKHATAVYSGETPSTIEFLQPEKTIEKNTDSLRDFIIALDKAKADKLRYKVEDKFVKIFITPYHTSLSETDLEFSQGDFNVDVIVAIGVHKREELDQTITAHGRILHDAVTISVNNKQTADLGAINWYDAEASSLSEMIVGLLEPIQGDKAILDSQIATSFLTGIVAETQRFSNTKTTAHTMNVSATLMKAGANQQLVASKLEAPKPVPAATTEKTFDTNKINELAKASPSEEGTSSASPVPTPRNDGSLSISHTEEKAKIKTLEDIAAENSGFGNDSDQPDIDLAKIHIDQEGRLLTDEQEKAAQAKSVAQEGESKMALTAPIISGNMNSTDIPQEPTPESPTPDQALAMGLSHGKTISPIPSSELPNPTNNTLLQLEEKVNSPHLQASTPLPSEDAARQAVATAATGSLEPVAALNAMPIELNDDQTDQTYPAQLVKPDTGIAADPNAGASNPSAPPLVPPPIMPPSNQ